MSYLGSLEMTWPLLKQKSSEEVVGQKMELRGAGTVEVCWVDFKEC